MKRTLINAKDLEIIGMDKKGEAMRVVFKLNISKQGSRFEPRGKEGT